MYRVQGGQILRLDRLLRGRVKSKRVDRSPVFPDPEIQMRSGGDAGRPDISDNIPLSDMGTGLDTGSITGEVHVGCGVSRIVTDLYRVAATICPAGAQHCTISNRHDRSAGGGGIIDGGVCSDLAGDRCLRW